MKFILKLLIGPILYICIQYYLYNEYYTTVEFLSYANSYIGKYFNWYYPSLIFGLFGSFGIFVENKALSNVAQNFFALLLNGLIFLASVWSIDLFASKYEGDLFPLVEDLLFVLVPIILLVLNYFFFFFIAEEEFLQHKSEDLSSGDSDYEYEKPRTTVRIDNEKSKKIKVIRIYKDGRRKTNKEHRY